MDPILPLARMSSAWEPGAWIGTMRRAFGPIAEIVEADGDVSDVVETFPPHTILALWKPQQLNQPFLRRWPHMVWMTTVDSERAQLELLREVPESARLWITPQDIDWALLAEIVMLSEKNLMPQHYHQLQRFIDQEREATSAKISRAYSDERQGFRSFSKTVPGSLT